MRIPREIERTVSHPRRSQGRGRQVGQGQQSQQDHRGEVSKVFHTKERLCSMSFEYGGYCVDVSGRVTSTTRNPRMKSVMNGLTPLVRRRPERQSASPASHAPPRITLTPWGFEAG